LQRRSVTPVEPLAKTAMLDAPAPLALAATNPKSSNVTPAVNPCSCSAYPLAGAIFAWSAATYTHCAGVVLQSSPPYTLTPSRDVPTTRPPPPGSVYVPALPHAYTRLPAAFARSIACPMLATGDICVPAFPSLPPADTKIPNVALTMHGSVVTLGVSELLGQSPLHTW
jgi:hypothetical protein